MSKRTDYVVGFMFDEAKERVVLIRKTKPKWQEGLFNGVGGKIECGGKPSWGVDWAEKPCDAMAREFKEETGVETRGDQWKFHGTMNGEDWSVWVYSIIGPVDEVKTIEEEEVVVFDVESLYGVEWVVPNLKWMIPFVLQDEAVFEVRYS